MLGKIILLFLQIAAAWFFAPIIRGQIPVGGAYDLFLYALLFAVVVYLTGILAAQVLKDVAVPSTATLTSALVVALIAAALVTFVPGIAAAIPGGTISNRGLVLAGAILGYFLRK